jgi:hypothetical protein
MSSGQHRAQINHAVSVPEGQPQVKSAVNSDGEVFDLRFYGSAEMAVPAWWIGIFDSSGTLRRTDIASRPDLSPLDLTLWLRPIVGFGIADQLVRLVAEDVTRARNELRLVEISQ